MPSQTFILRTVTPAFLGNAEQRSEWRTPPLKACLRQWWRLLRFSRSYNQGKHPTVAALREKEGEVFGHAWLEHNKRPWFFRSVLKLSLERWEPGAMTAVSGEDKVHHPNVKFPVGALLYLGYGPLLYGGGATVLKAPPGLAPASYARLRLFWYEREGQDLDKLVTWLAVLVHWFGAVGGRSRNGWGSLQLFSEEGKPVTDLVNLKSLETCFLNLDECLQQEWPAALGKDERGPLVWWGQRAHPTWQDAMKELAAIKIAFRTVLPLGTPGEFYDRHFLGYPVTKHMVRAWGPQRRLAGQLRFKVHAVQGTNAREVYLPMAFHLPHKLPRELEMSLDPAGKKKATLENQIRVWREVHKVLDKKMRRATF